jgi:hypothetical protein
MKVFWTASIISGVGVGRGTPYERCVVSCGSAPSARRVGLNLKYKRALSNSVPTMASESMPRDFSSSAVAAIFAIERRQNGQYRPLNRPSNTGVLPR